MTKLYYTIFNLLALAAIIYIGIDAFYKVLRVKLRQVHPDKIVMHSASDKKRYVQTQLTDYQVIGDRNIFSKLEKEPIDGDTPKIENLEPTSLKIKLLGTVAGNSQNAAAVIEDTGKRTQGLYRVGDSVRDAIVKSILRGKVVLRVEDRNEILTMEEPASDKKESQKVSRAESSKKPAPLARSITVRRSDINQSFENISELLSQASIRPHFNDGQADGLAITGIKAGSIFRKMGLRNGDIVQGVGGTDIKSPDDLISLYNDLKSESNISLQIKRRGRERTMNYRFRD
jgi:general secretion pathway protein C